MSIQISLQVGMRNFNSASHRKHRVFVISDNSYQTFTARTRFLLNGKVREVQRGIDEQIDRATIEFTAQAFGGLINFTTPIAIAIDNASNIIFRGFLVGDTGILNRTEDVVTAQALGFRWILNKVSKLRGKIFTVDNNINPPINSSFETTSRLFEKFRLPLPTDTNAVGFLGGERCIFNEGGIGNAAQNGKNNKDAVAFKKDPSRSYTENADSPNNINHSWSFSSILRYIERYYILPFVKDYFIGTKLRVSEKSYKRIDEWGETIGEANIVPLNFDIDGLGPMEAIERMVRLIPGPWYWKINHFKNISEVELINDLARDDQPKALFIGTGGKILGTDNRTNVAGLTASRSIQQGTSHAIGLGGLIKIETTLEYIPVWPRYLRDKSELTKKEKDIPIDDPAPEWDGKPISGDKYLSNFKDRRDYEKWKHFKNGLKPEQYENTTGKEITAADLRRYEQIFRRFALPGDSKELIRNFEGITLPSEVSGQYGGYTGDISGFIFQNIDSVRTIEPPLTKYQIAKTKFKSGIEQNLAPSKPFVFLFDSGRALEPRAAIAIASLSQKEQDKIKAEAKFIIPESDKEVFKGNYSFDNNFRIIKFSKPQYTTALEDLVNNKDLAIAFRGFAGANPKNVFVTCRIGMDVPAIADKLDLLRVATYGEGRFVSYKFDRKAELTIRASAIFPHTLIEGVPEISYTEPENDNLTGKLTIPTTTANKNNKFKLLDFNMLDGEGNLVDSVPTQKIMKNDFGVLTQSVEDILNSNPEIEENFNVNHGRVDLSYDIGDVIDRVIGSELANGSEGYYGLNALVVGQTISARGGTDAWRTTSTLRNRKGFMLGDLKPRESP